MKLFEDSQQDAEHTDGVRADDRFGLETLTSPCLDRSVPVVITITLLLTLVIAVSGGGGLVASVVLCAMCAVLAKVKAAGRFWTAVPTALTALSVAALIVHIA